MRTVLLFVATALALTGCNKVAKGGGEVLAKTVVAKVEQKTVSSVLRSRLETVSDKVAAAELVPILERNPELLSLLEKKPEFLNKWVYLNQNLPKTAADSKFVRLFLDVEKYSKEGRFAGNKIENFIYKETGRGTVTVESKSGVQLAEITLNGGKPIVKVLNPKDNKFANLHPFPNAKYVFDNAEYLTDDIGRTVSSSFKIDKNYYLTPDLYNRKDITAIGKYKCAEQGYDGGHLLGQAFGGSSSVLNIVPMKALVNRSGEYRKLEKRWTEAADAGKTVKARVSLKYEGASERPAWIDVKYEIDGKEFSELISNI